MHTRKVNGFGIAHDLIVWTQAVLLDDELQTAEAKRLRYRLLHVAARIGVL